MFTVALIGPDGAGKTTIGKQIESSLELPVKYLYMGVNTSASNFALPTTRAIAAVKKLSGAPDPRFPSVEPSEKPAKKRGPLYRALRSVKGTLGMTNRIVEEWYRQFIASYYRLRGKVVLYDRHFLYDFYHPDAAPKRPMSPLRRFHLWMLLNVYPRPELVICLDAPAEVMFARKGEFSIPELDQRRRNYLRMGSLAKKFVVVDATQPLSEVTRQVAEHMRTYHTACRGQHPKTGDAHA